MKATRTPPPVPVPDDIITLEMTATEARGLAGLMFYTQTIPWALYKHPGDGTFRGNTVALMDKVRTTLDGALKT